ncbi:MAG: sigma-70 family RNA polymerase sigma factor [Acidothermales bacterium]|nr:sigma-70 family RNA polymerase sigma factor [Acidothermales bacterium]
MRGDRVTGDHGRVVGQPEECQAGGRPLSQDEAFDRYVVPEVDFLYRVALALAAQPADAEDLVQDTLIRAYRAVERFDGAYPRAWLATILRNTHLNRVRKRLPVLLRDDETAQAVFDQGSRDTPTTEDIVVDSQFDAVVVEALAALPEKYRAVVQLVDVQGLTYREAADALGIPRGTVMSRLHRARARVRARLNSAGLVAKRPQP